nr:MAG TPA: hypothetical protein [Caudoviricetes sp.]
MQLPQIVEVKGIRVLTSKQLAEEYSTTADRIKQNFGENRKYFIDGKHYISLTGDDLRTFKDQVRKESNQGGKNALVANRTSHLYLWTEKGALLHAKSLNTDKAWQVYDYLVDFYFRAKEKEPEITEKKVEKRVQRTIDISSEVEILKAIQKIKRDLICMDVLLEECETRKTESGYNDTRFEAMRFVTSIVRDCNKLLELHPKVIKEVSW